MTRTNQVGLVFLIAAIACLSVLSVDALISSILIGGKVTVTELEGMVQYTSNPFTEWTGAISIQSGATWRCRIENLTIDFTGDVNVTWSLFDAGPDGIIGTGDDLTVPGASFTQTESMVATVPETIVSSIDGFNPYNWGQWTSSPMVVYVQAEVTEG